MAAVAAAPVVVGAMVAVCGGGGRRWRLRLGNNDRLESTEEDDDRIRSIIVTDWRADNWR